MILIDCASVRFETMVFDSGGAARTNGPIHEAAMAGDVALTTRLLQEEPASANARGWRNWTALIWASRENRGQVVDLLLQHGADPDARTDDGWTALHSAASCGHADVIKRLLAGGADCTILDGGGDCVGAVA